MAARLNKAHQDDGLFYVYAIRRDEVIVYVGKGSGRRSAASARRCGGVAEIVKRFSSEDKAFAFEREMIAKLSPEMNISAGGNGGRVKKRVRRATRRPALTEMERVGMRVYAARFLLTRLNEHNCEQYGVSKVDLSRLAEVANGCPA